MGEDALNLFQEFREILIVGPIPHHRDQCPVAKVMPAGSRGEGARRVDEIGQAADNLGAFVRMLEIRFALRSQGGSGLSFKCGSRSQS
jgi:hypothetical protein